MDETAFLLDDITFPLTTETPEFSIDDFQWDTSGATPVVSDHIDGSLNVLPAIRGTLVIKPSVRGTVEITPSIHGILGINP